MLSIRSLVKKLDVFERNKVPLELKVLGWPSTSSFAASGGPPGLYQRSIGSPRRLSGSGLGS
jgi:hypothetical protein